MTQTEIEAELVSLRQQLSQMQQQQENRKQDRRRLANVSVGVAILCLAAGTLMGLVGLAHPAPDYSPLFLTCFPLVFLSLGLRA
jgi:hypothetical protein